MLKQVVIASLVLCTAAIPNLFHLERRQQINLRILPLGDSITFGRWSTGSNGYRLKLESKLEAAGYKVHYIGNNFNADDTPDTMLNYQHDGWIGDTNLKIIRDGLTTFNGSAPPANLVLLHGGSNDCLQLSDPQVALGDLATLIDKIHCLNKDTAVVVAQIINNRNNSQVNTLIKQYNGYIPYLVNDRVSNHGYKLQAVNMGNLSETQFAYLGAGYDDRHPSEAGFQSMATNWLAGIKAADTKGLIGPPSGTYSANAAVGSVSGSAPLAPSPGTSLASGTAPPGGVPTVRAC